ncbi:hypothetical protein, partial [Acinetobacter baumannii]|uniref:hypothetical protein n=1 Tax=Acinetobacter baumannii TaxID=470 RepID=UPI00339AB931
MEAADDDDPETLLPLLDVPATAAAPAAAGRQLLAEHTFSATQIRMYLACPLQFFYGRVLGI